MAHLAHHDRGFFCSLIILVPPNTGPPSENTVDWLWSQQGTIFLVKEPEPGMMMVKMGKA